jgi:hypothetical protein
MSQEWDDLDRIIGESEEEVVLSSDYEKRLMEMAIRANTERDQSYIGAFSLILAGLMALFIYTSDIQYKMANIQARARVELIQLQNDYYNKGILKYFIGE